MNQLSPEARRLFQLARERDEPSSVALNRIERSLASRLARGVGIAAASALWAQSASGVLLGTTKVVSIAVIAGAASAVGLWAWQSPTPSTHVPVAVVAPARDVRDVQTPSKLQPAAATSEAPAAPTETAAPSPGPAALRTAARPALAAESAWIQAPDTTDRLLEETQELRRAQQALRSGNVALALGLLKQQDQKFNHGVLQEERSAARVLALCQSGQRDLARSEAARFERRWPKSALLARVRSSCL